MNDQITIDIELSERIIKYSKQMTLISEALLQLARENAILETGNDAVKLKEITSEEIGKLQAVIKSRNLSVNYS